MIDCIPLKTPTLVVISCTSPPEQYRLNVVGMPPIAVTYFSLDEARDKAKSLLVHFPGKQVNVWRLVETWSKSLT